VPDLGQYGQMLMHLLQLKDALREDLQANRSG
jgi:hypothetical protein